MKVRSPIDKKIKSLEQQAHIHPRELKQVMKEIPINSHTWNQNILSLIQQNKLKPPATMIDFTIMINFFSKRKDMNKAMQIFETMKQRNVQCDVFVFTSLIDGHCKNGDINRATQMVEAMQQQGTKPNEVTFNSLIDGHFKNGDTNKATQLFKLMQQQGIKPNDRTLMDTPRMETWPSNTGV